MEKTGNKILDMLQENNLIAEEEEIDAEVDATDAEDLEEDIVVEDADDADDDDIDLEEEVIDLAEEDDPAEGESPLDEDVMNILNIVESVTAAYAEEEVIDEE